MRIVVQWIIDQEDGEPWPVEIVLEEAADDPAWKGIFEDNVREFQAVASTVMILEVPDEAIEKAFDIPVVQAEVIESHG